MQQNIPHPVTISYVTDLVIDCVEQHLTIKSDDTQPNNNNK